jgi:hypothetical protein
MDFQKEEIREKVKEKKIRNTPISKAGEAELGKKTRRNKSLVRYL